MQAGVRERSHNINIEKVKKENEAKTQKIIKKYEKRIAIYQNDKDIYLQRMGTNEEEIASYKTIEKIGLFKELKRQEKERLFYEYQVEKEKKKAKKAHNYCGPFFTYLLT